MSRIKFGKQILPEDLHTLDIEGSDNRSTLILNKHINLGSGTQSYILDMRESILGNYGFKKPLDRELSWNKHEKILYAPTVDTTDLIMALESENYRFSTNTMTGINDTVRNVDILGGYQYGAVYPSAANPSQRAPSKATAINGYNGMHFDGTKCASGVGDGIATTANGRGVHEWAITMLITTPVDPDANRAIFCLGDSASMPLDLVVRHLTTGPNEVLAWRTFSENVINFGGSTFYFTNTAAASKTGVGNEATHLLTFGCKDDTTNLSADPTPFANLNGTGGGVGGTVRGEGLNARKDGLDGFVTNEFPTSYSYGFQSDVRLIEPITFGNEPNNINRTLVRPYTGGVYDFVMYNYSEANVDKIEGYMAHKFGLESTLPSDHTYKNSAPTISNA